MKQDINDVCENVYDAAEISVAFSYDGGWLNLSPSQMKALYKELQMAKKYAEDCAREKFSDAFHEGLGGDFVVNNPQKKEMIEI